MVIFSKACETIKANKLLRTIGLDSKIMSPHPKFRHGSCALGLEIDMAQKDAVEFILNNSGIVYAHVMQNPEIIQKKVQSSQVCLYT